MNPGFRISILLLLGISAAGCTVVNGAGDPVRRGAMVQAEFDRIPQQYVGNWADKPENCGVSADRGRQAVIGPESIGEARVIRLFTYSDHPSLVVELDAGEGEPVTLSLNLSREGAYLSIGREQSRAEVLVRCTAG